MPSTISQATPSQISALSQRGIAYCHLPPALCPCPMHDPATPTSEPPDHASIRIGRLAVRTPKTDWDTGCIGQNMRSAITSGRDAFPRSPLSQTGKSLAGPHRLGYFSFPKGLGSKARCAISGEALWPQTQSAQREGDRWVMSDYNSMNVPEKEGLLAVDHSGYQLSTKGTTFFASYENGTLKLYKDSADVAKTLIATHDVKEATDCSLPGEWNTSGKDAKGRITVPLHWTQIGSTLELPEEMAKSQPLDFYRCYTAWDYLTLGYPVDQMAEILASVEAGKPAMVALAKKSGKSSTAASFEDSVRPIVNGQYLSAAT